MYPEKAIIWKNICTIIFLAALFTITKTWKSESCSVVSHFLQLHGLYSWIFPTQGSDPGLLHCRWILYQLSHKESPRILEWVAYPFSSGYSHPRNQTRLSCAAGRFFTNWAIREAVTKIWKQPKCPSTEEWIKNMWYLCTMAYYSAIKKKKNEIDLFFLRPWTKVVIRSSAKVFLRVEERILKAISPILT